MLDPKTLWRIKTDVNVMPVRLPSAKSTAKGPPFSMCGVPGNGGKFKRRFKTTPVWVKAANTNSEIGTTRLACPRVRNSAQGITHRRVEPDGDHDSAICKYMNAKKVPQLFVQSGATKWNDPKSFPWTMGWIPSYQTEGHIDASYLLDNHAKGRVAVLYQNDDFGEDYLTGLRDGLAGKMPIVAEVSYEAADPTIDSQILTLRAPGADVFANVTTGKFATQAIKKIAEIGWKPVHLLDNVSLSVAAVLKPGGFPNAQGILAAGYTRLTPPGATIPL
jgi:hypothetical protein